MIDRRWRGELGQDPEPNAGSCQGAYRFRRLRTTKRPPVISVSAEAAELASTSGTGVTAKAPTVAVSSINAMRIIFKLSS